MRIKNIILLTILLTTTIWSQAQQINPVPDYVFRNQMSVGRNAVTDTAAYFSIGPRYGATKGFMPPIVGDTATFSSGKRNGLLIFSVQKNKFLYWDSVRVQWSDMAGSSGSYIVAGDTASMLAPYLRKADTTAMLSPYFRKADTATLSNRINLKLNISDTSSMLGNYIRHAGYGLTKSGQSFLVDTLNIATRAWRQKGLDSLAALEVSGSGTTNYVPKFTASSTIGNSQIFDNGTNVGIGTASPSSILHIQNSTPTFTIRNPVIADATQGAANNLSAGLINFGANGAFNVVGSIETKYASDASFGRIADMIFSTRNTTSLSERLRITSVGDVGIGTQSPSTFVHVQKNQNAVTTLRVENTDTTSSGARANISVKNVDVDYHITSIGKTGAGINAAFAGTNSNHTLYLMTNGTARQTIFANGRIGVNTTTDAGYQFDVNGTLRSVNGANFATTSGNVGVGTTTAGGKLTINSSLGDHIQIQRSGQTDRAIVISAADQLVFGTWASPTQMALTSTGNLLVNTTTDAGYRLDVNGTLRSVNGANFATTSGNVGIGTASPGYKLSVKSATDYNIGIGVLGGFASINVLNDAASAYTQLRIDANPILINSYSGAETLLNTTTDAGDYKLQVVGRGYFQGAQQDAAQTIMRMAANNASAQVKALDFQINAGSNLFVFNTAYAGTAMGFDFADAGTSRMRMTSDGELLVATTSDAGDYKLQVVGNARIGTGKLDIASNTTFGIGVARSGTSEVAGQIYNSNGILYLGAESSTGGQIFSGSSAYAGVIGTGANYPLQFAVNNITRGGFSTSGNLLLGFTTDSYFLKLQVNGSIFSNNQIIAQNTAAQLNIDSSTNISPLYISNQSLTGSSAQGLFYGNTTWNTTGNPSLIDLAITNTASGSDANYIKISDGSNIFRVTKAAEVVTAAPTGGSIRKWKLGEAATVSPTSPNRTIRVEIDGTVYYLHAKTTND